MVTGFPLLILLAIGVALFGYALFRPTWKQRGLWLGVTFLWFFGDVLVGSAIVKVLCTFASKTEIYRIVEGVEGYYDDGLAILPSLNPGDPLTAHHLESDSRFILSRGYLWKEIRYCSDSSGRLGKECIYVRLTADADGGPARIERIDRPTRYGIFKTQKQYSYLIGQTIDEVRDMTDGTVLARSTIHYGSNGGWFFFGTGIGTSCPSRSWSEMLIGRLPEILRPVKD